MSEEGFTLKETCLGSHKSQQDFEESVKQVRKKPSTLQYQETTSKKGMSGSPIWLMTAQGNFIIGVHTVSGEDYGQSNGTLFYDDKGLIDIFGYETIKEFIRKIPEYKTKQQSQTGNFKY